VVVDATTSSLGRRRLTKVVVLDTTRPVTRILRARRVKSGTSIRLSVSENVNAAFRLGGKTVRRPLAKGTHTVVLQIRTQALTVYSFDLAGNAAKPASARVG
jgi:hypothetical protein